MTTRVDDALRQAADALAKLSPADQERYATNMAGFGSACIHISNDGRVRLVRPQDYLLRDDLQPAKGNGT